MNRVDKQGNETEDFNVGLIGFENEACVCPTAVPVGPSTSDAHVA